MIDFGDTLRRAREDKGLTIAQISDMTHMMPQQVEDLERENFSRIAAPIYGRGFVKLYCEAVGLDPKPLVAEFMDIFNGTRAPTIRMRSGAAAKPKPASAPKPEPAEPRALADDDEPFAGIISAATEAPADARASAPMPEPPPAPAPEPAPAPADEPASTPEPAFRLEPETIVSAPLPRPEPSDFAKSAPRGPSRYAAPEPIAPFKSHTFEIPPAVWRILALAVVASLILYGVFALVRKVWNAATIAPPADAHVAEVSAPEERELPGAPKPAPTPVAPSAVSPAQAPAKRTPLPVPPLYID